MEIRIIHKLKELRIASGDVGRQQAQSLGAVLGCNHFIENDITILLIPLLFVFDIAPDKKKNREHHNYGSGPKPAKRHYKRHEETEDERSSGSNEPSADN